MTENPEKSFLLITLTKDLCEEYQHLPNVMTTTSNWDGQLSGVDFVCLDEPLFLGSDANMHKFIASDSSILAIGSRYFPEFPTDSLQLIDFIKNGFTIIDC
jgi:hypothetical protein